MGEEPGEGRGMPRAGSSWQELTGMPAAFGAPPKGPGREPGFWRVFNTYSGAGSLHAQACQCRHRVLAPRNVQL